MTTKILQKDFWSSSTAYINNMTDFPNTPFSPREKENKYDVVYEPEKKKVIFVEDIKAIENEVIAVENTLLNTDGAKIPYGVEIGGVDSHVQFVEFDTGAEKVPQLLAPRANGLQTHAIILPNIVGMFSHPTEITGILLINSSNNIVGVVGYDEDLYAYKIQANTVVDGNFKVLGNFEHGDGVGTTKVFTVITSISRNGSDIVYKQREGNFDGGICTYLSDESDWIIL